MSVRGESKDRDLLDMLVLRAELARAAKGAVRRNKIVKCLSQTADKIVRPKIDPARFRDAMVNACVERPDFGDPVVLDMKHGKVHLNGTFDLSELASEYFATRGETIDA
jgi:hypothetical protein